MAAMSWIEKIEVQTALLLKKAGTEDRFHKSGSG